MSRLRQATDIIGLMNHSHASILN